MPITPAPRHNENGGHHARGGRQPILDSVKFALICERYAETGLAYKSCEELGFNYSSVMFTIKDQFNRGDETWQDAWDEAHAIFRESLERAIFERGRDGKPRKWLTDKEGKPVLDAEGRMIVTEVEYSDRMLELAAKGHFPERYRDKIFVSGNVGLEPVDAFANLTARAKREIRAIILRDLEEQREASAGTVIEGAVIEQIADMRKEEGDD